MALHGIPDPPAAMTEHGPPSEGLHWRDALCRVRVWASRFAWHGVLRRSGHDGAWPSMGYLIPPRGHEGPWPSIGVFVGGTRSVASVFGPYGLPGTVS